MHGIEMLGVAKKATITSSNTIVQNPNDGINRLSTKGGETKKDLTCFVVFRRHDDKYKDLEMCKLLCSKYCYSKRHRPNNICDSPRRGEDGRHASQKAFQHQLHNAFQ